MPGEDRLRAFFADDVAALERLLGTAVARTLAMSATALPPHARRRSSANAIR